MASSLPTPLAAAIGLVPAVLEGVRRLPGRAVQLPVLAVSSALNGMDALHREYGDLAQRGDRLVARLRGQAVEQADRIEEVLEGVTETALRAPAGFAAAAEDAAEGPAAEVAPLVGRVRKAAGNAADTMSSLADRADELADRTADAAARGAGEVHDAADTLADTADRAAAAAAAPPAVDPEAPKGVPTPKAVEPDSTRVDTAATPDVVEVVEQAAAGSSSAALGHDDLPLPDYDHMTLGSLRGRLRALSVDQLVQVRTYEKAHADRLPVVTMLDNRIAKLATDAAAAPSGPVSTSPAPEQLAAAAGPAGAVSPATTDAPPINPPSQGDPTNPAQPRG